MSALSYDTGNNIMRAYTLLLDLSNYAKDRGLHPTTLIDEGNDGELYFKVNDIGAELGRAFLKDINTEEASIFNQKAEVFRAYWMELIDKAEKTNAARINELKAELAKLEGRA